MGKAGVLAHKPHVRKAAWCEGSRFSNVRVLPAPEALRAAVRLMAGREKLDADRIPPAPRARVSRRGRGWAELLDCRRRECRRNLQDGRAPLGAVRDSVISKDLKKVR